MDTILPEVRPSRRGWKLLARKAGGVLLSWALFLGAGYLLLYPFLHPAHKKTEEPAVEIAEVPVRVREVASRPVRRAIETVGTLFGFEEITLSANVDGRVTRLLVDVASRVTPGQPLLEIDRTNYELNAQQAQQALRVEWAKLGLQTAPPQPFDLETLPAIREAKSRLSYARNNEQRIRQLSQASAVSAQDLEAATTDLQTAQAAYDAQVLTARSALAIIDLQTEKLKLAEQQLAETRLVAPPINEAIPITEFEQVFAVATRSVAEGTYVRTGTEVLRLVIDGYLKLKVAVPERYVAQVQVGQRVEIQTAATSAPTWGQVARVNPAIQVSTRTFEVEIWVDNAARGLKPGGFAKAAIIVQEETQATMVPWESIVTFAGITKVFRVDEGRAQAVPVVLGVAEQEWVEVVGAPLKPGDLVIVSGQTNLADQTPIRSLPPIENMATAAATSTLASPDQQPSRATGETP